MADPIRIVSCPQCGASAAWHHSNPHRPFCSERCKLIDFGDWAGERHSIPGQEHHDELYSEDLARNDSGQPAGGEPYGKPPS